MAVLRRTSVKGGQKPERRESNAFKKIRKKIDFPLRDFLMKCIFKRPPSILGFDSLGREPSASCFLKPDQ
jgi:hypothetical protein